jgi:ABC-type branched-subunit amino acid transport system substrate-binding protein
MLSPGLTNPGLTNSTDAWYDGLNFNAMHPAGKIDSFFRLLAADDSQVGVAATALRQAGASRIYVLDDGQPYGTSVGDFFAAKLGTYGGALAGRDSVLDAAPATAVAQVARIVAAKADGIFYAGAAARAAGIRQAMTKPLPFVMMSQPTTDPTYIEDAGPAAEGTLDVTATPDVATLRSADAAQFVASYTQRFGAAPTPLAVSAYDAAEIAIGTLRSIINHGNVPYLVSVLNQVATQQYTGVAGSYWFTTSGDNVQAGPINIYVVRDGNWALAQSI